MSLKQLWRIITRQETPMEKARRAISGARADTRWLAKPALSDSVNRYNARKNKNES